MKKESWLLPLLLLAATVAAAGRRAFAGEESWDWPSFGLSTYP